MSSDSAQRTQSKYARRGRAGSSLLARGEPMIWLTGGALALSLVMIVGLVGWIFWQGLVTFWPVPLVQFDLHKGAPMLGEVRERQLVSLTDSEQVKMLPVELSEQVPRLLSEGKTTMDRLLIRTGNFDITRTDFQTLNSPQIKAETNPEWAVAIERQEKGIFFGFPLEFLIDGKVIASEPQAIWAAYEQYHNDVYDRFYEIRNLQQFEIGDINRRLEAARLAIKQAELDYGEESAQRLQAESAFHDLQVSAAAETAVFQAKIDALAKENARFEWVFETIGKERVTLPLSVVVRAYRANQLDWSGRLGVYAARWSEFLCDAPREANSEGGVLPAIWGTVAMTLLMTIVVVPFGVLAALYLREYAKAGFMVSMVRIAINNLAGVPSIVFGVFGLGFFCYVIGARIDEVFFAAKLADNNPTFGTGGIMWASLTLALLTLPVVIVATEEALAAVPKSMREGSYGCGASKWQTIHRIVLPRALPGIMTGMILAMARGAGEVAPLMLVGAVKLTQDLPIDTVFPFVHPERSFMHLGYHIFDVGFQSRNVDAAKPMVFTSTLLLIAIVAALNLTAIWLRSRLRRKFVSAQF